MQHMNQQIHFLKNVSIMGGMLMVFAFGPGTYSVDKHERDPRKSAVRARGARLHLADGPVGTFTVRRALPFRERHSVGPWVFLDHFGPFRVKPGEDGVGPHPHAGIETVTYLLSGRNEHRDSAGPRRHRDRGRRAVDDRRRGIVHAEQPLAETEAELTMHGIQLWTSLPRAA